jgi:hypothetical protein
MEETARSQGVDGGDSTFAGCEGDKRKDGHNLDHDEAEEREREIDALPCSMLKLSHAR